MKSILVSTVLLLATMSLASAQGQKKTPLSPKAETSATLNGKTVSIQYSSPQMRNRKIFGELVPFGQVWRAGADNATSLHTDADLMIGPLVVPKGDYTIYVLPNQTEWSLIINKQTGQWGTEYHEEQDLGRVQMLLKDASNPIEGFKITLSGAGKKGMLQLEWANTIATVPVEAK